MLPGDGDTPKFAQLYFYDTDNEVDNCLNHVQHLKRPILCQLQVRDGDFNVLMKSHRLMQQYAVDEWARIEFCRMQWVRNNQKAIRAEKHKGLHDAVTEGDSVNAGRKIILPPTIYNSPQFYSEAFMNAMTIVRHMGKPDYFITITTNPHWPEIVEALHDGEQPQDRPDLCARVFKLKLTALMQDLLKKHILGKVQAYVYTIEWKKRGLTHCHILLIMANEYKPRTPEIIDSAVSAELPDKDTNPQLFQIVTKHMIHEPCGQINPNAPCMEHKGAQKVCTKGFPKMFTDHTSIPEDSYPKYRRKSPASGGQKTTIRVRGTEVNLDKSSMVPYNPLLLLRYQAHVNVEVVHSVQAVKYLYKYITKGQDRVILSMRGGGGEETALDEVDTFLNARYISTSEALWRI